MTSYIKLCMLCNSLSQPPLRQLKLLEKISLRGFGARLELNTTSIYCKLKRESEKIVSTALYQSGHRKMDLE